MGKLQVVNLGVGCWVDSWLAELVFYVLRNAVNKQLTKLALDDFLPMKTAQYHYILKIIIYIKNEFANKTSCTNFYYVANKIFGWTGA
jgi:hypothetical protein